MQQKPIGASFGGGWRSDNAGMMSPVGGSAGEKELLRLPKELSAELAVSANTLMRGRLARELWPDLALLSTIAPRHARTKLFIANITAGSMGEDGAARREYLEGLARMLVPSWGPTPAIPSKLRDGNGKKQQGSSSEDNE